MSNILVRNDELKHYGVLGMRWGTRRFQNRDGSLTRAGIKRYGASEEEATDKQRQTRQREKTRSLAKLEKYNGLDATRVSRLSESGQNALANFEVGRSRKQFWANVGLMAITAGRSYIYNLDTSHGVSYVQHLLANPSIKDMPYREVLRQTAPLLKDREREERVFEKELKLIIKKENDELRRSERGNGR